MQAENTKIFLNATEAAKLLGLHQETVLRMMKLGQIKTVRLVARQYIPRSSVLALISDDKVTA